MQLGRHPNTAPLLAVTAQDGGGVSSLVQSCIWAGTAIANDSGGGAVRGGGARLDRLSSLLSGKGRDVFKILWRSDCGSAGVRSQEA